MDKCEYCNTMGSTSCVFCVGEGIVFASAFLLSVVGISVFVGWLFVSL